jgi:hypothetical protein
MTSREKRRFLKRQIAESERLKELAGDHPLMGPLVAQREEEFRQELQGLPAGGREARTVLFFTGDPVYGSKGIDAHFASTVLLPFLEMVKSEYVAEKHGHVGERGPRRDEDEARLLLTGLPRGSFGLELSHPESEDLFAEEQLSNVLVKLTELFSSAGKSDEDFVHALEEVSPRVYARLPEFFKSIHDHGANIRMQTGDLEFALDKDRVSDAFTRVSSVHTIENEVEKEGVFRGATLDTWKFDFRTDNGETISGRLAADLSEATVADMLKLTNRPSIARFKETKITTQGGAVRTRYELLNVTGRVGRERLREPITE